MSFLWCVVTAVKSVKLTNADSTTAISFARLIFWQAVQIQLKRKSKFKHQCQHLHKNNFFFIPYKVPSSPKCSTYYTNLEITLRVKNSYLLFNMPADRPLVDSCIVYSNVAFRAGAACTFLHSASGFAATTRQKDMVKNITSTVGLSRKYTGKLLQTWEQVDLGFNLDYRYLNSFKRGHMLQEQSEIKQSFSGKHPNVSTFI